VKHNYHDHAFDPDEHDEEEEEDIRVNRKGVVSQSFPMKLHAVLEQVEADGFADIVSWQSHGRCFIIHKPNVGVEIFLYQWHQGLSASEAVLSSQRV
jgi:hypothetical protein